MAYVLTPEEIETRETYDAEADRYNAINSAHWKDATWYSFISRLRGDVVLDLGCGTGRDCLLFLEEGLRYLGVDFSRKMLDIAERDFADEIEKGKARFLEMNA